MTHYQGYLIYELDNESLAHYYQDKQNWMEQEPKESFINNEYIFITSKEKPEQVLDIWKFQNDHFDLINNSKIISSFGGTIRPRNAEQKAAIDMLHDENTPIKLITGCFGSGKTMLLVSAALEALEKNQFSKIIWVRNNVQVKDTDALGALPGSELDKMLPYVMPMADHCGGIEGIKKMLAEGTLEVIPLGFLRGRSIRDAIIISSESENLTKEHIQLIMGRVDQGSELWMDGDIKQRDRAAFEKSQGLETMIDRLKGQKLFGYIHLNKSERSPTAAMADLLD